MPAKSKSQQRFLCMRAHRKGATAKDKDLCREFAVSGKAFKQLPERKKKGVRRGTK